MSRFDINRNINENQIAEVIGAQEELISQLRAQIEALTQHQQQAIRQEFPLKMKDILTQLRQLKALDNTHDVNAFINSVEAIFALCPADNPQLMNLAMAIVINEKVSGAVGSYVRQLGTGATWDQVKAKLTEHYKPRTTYSDIFNRCRNIKVSNLRELFNYFDKAKYELSQVYLFDENKPDIFRPDRTDKDLVNILIEKIDIPMRIHLNHNTTLNDIATKYSQIKALDDPRTIHLEHRKNANNYYKTANKNRQNQDETIPSTYGYRYNQTNTLPNRNGYNQNHSASNIHSHRQNNTNIQNNLNNNNSNQTRITRMSRFSRNSEPEPMDIGTFQEEQVTENRDLNFIVSPQNQYYP